MSTQKATKMTIAPIMKLVMRDENIRLCATALPNGRGALRTALMKIPHSSPSAELIRRAVPPLALWLVGTAIKTPRVSAALRRLDRHVVGRFVPAISALALPPAPAAKSVRRYWPVIAGAAAIVFGIGLLARTAKAQ